MRRQCELLSINRSTLYYKNKELNVSTVDLLNMIRDVWMRRPFYGYRRVTKELNANGVLVNRKRVQRLMYLGGVKAIYPGPNTSKRNQKDAVHPYLLRGLEVNRPNQVWQIDITYLHLNDGFMYLIALIDVHSRYVVAWVLSNTLDTASCVEALRNGIEIVKPEIINSDQGCQFTSKEWIDILREEKIKISMTGKGRCLDNVYIERFWRSFKQEEFYLNEHVNVPELKKSIANYMKFYNHERWHQSLDYKRPADVYFGAAGEGDPVNIWTSPTGQPAPCGACGQTVDNAIALPTA